MLRLDPAKSALSITETRGRATAVVSAQGSWTPAGAMVDMFTLRRVLEPLESLEIDLIVAGREIIIPTPHGHIRLKLLPFGPESRRPVIN